MKYKNLKKSIVIASIVGAFSSVSTQVYAAITNPAIGELGDNAAEAESGGTFTGYFVTIWRALIFVGALALLFNLVNGAFDWIVAGGDSGKIQKGRDKMVQSVIGMIILVSSFLVISYVSNLFFDFDLLNLTIPQVGDSGSGGSGVGTGLPAGDRFPNDPTRLPL